jgi:hypothetical protein
MVTHMHSRREAQVVNETDRCGVVWCGVVVAWWHALYWLCGWYNWQHVQQLQCGWLNHRIVREEPVRGQSAA